MGKVLGMKCKHPRKSLRTRPVACNTVGAEVWLSFLAAEGVRFALLTAELLGFVIFLLRNQLLGMEQPSACGLAPSQAA